MNNFKNFDNSHNYQQILLVMNKNNCCKMSFSLIKSKDEYKSSCSLNQLNGFKLTNSGCFVVEGL